MGALYEALEAKASRTHDLAEYALVKLKEKQKALRRAGIPFVMVEVPAYLLEGGPTPRGGRAKPAPAAAKPAMPPARPANRMLKRQDHAYSGISDLVGGSTRTGRG